MVVAIVGEPPCEDEHGSLAALAAESDATPRSPSSPLPLPISMPAVSRHLKVLGRAALTSRTQAGKWRTSRLKAAPLRDAADWIERFRRLWDSSFTRLDAHLAAVQAADRATVRPGGYQRWTEVSLAEPGLRVHIHADLTDVADGELLDGVMHVTGQLPDGIEPFT